MRHLDFCDLQRNLDMTSDFGTCAADSENIGGQVLKWVDRGARQLAVVKRRAHHRKRRATVKERFANLHSADHFFWKQLSRASNSRRHGVSRLRLWFCRLCGLLTTALRTVLTEITDATTHVAAARRFTSGPARKRDVAEFVTLKADCWVRDWFWARSTRLRRLSGGHHVGWARVRLGIVGGGTVRCTRFIMWRRYLRLFIEIQDCGLFISCVTRARWRLLDSVTSTWVNRVWLVTRSEWRRGTAQVVHSLDSGGSRRGIRKTYCLAYLRSLYNWEPLECALRSLTLQILARRRIRESNNKMVDSERQLRFGWKPGMRVRTEIGGPRCIRSHRFRSRLSKPSKPQTIRVFELELSEECDQSISKFFVQPDSVSEVQSVNLFSILVSEPGEYEETPAVTKAATKREE